MGMMGGDGLGRLIFRLLIAVGIAALGFLYFGLVLPRPAAALVALLLAAIELLGPMIDGKGGLSLRAIAKLGAALLVWPGLAGLIQLTGYVPDRDARIAIAAGLASALGVFAAGHGQGRENVRLVAVIVSLALPAYAITMALFDPNAIGVAAACLAVGVGAVTAKIALVWPQRHEDLMLVCGGIAFACAGGLLVAVML